MQAKQSRICFGLPKNGAYMNHTIWQGETECKPWAVHIEGYLNSKMKVKIYHEDINEYGVLTYRLDAPTPWGFVTFVSEQIKMFSRFPRWNMEVRPEDLLALYSGFKKGELNALYGLGGQ